MLEHHGEPWTVEEGKSVVWDRLLGVPIGNTARRIGRTEAAVEMLFLCVRGDLSHRSAIDIATEAALDADPRFEGWRES